MSRTGALAVVSALLALVFAAFPSQAQEPDAADVDTAQLFIGQQAIVTLWVYTAAGAAVEVDPAAPTWNGVEVIRLVRDETADEGAQVLHRIELLVAPFAPGAASFSPAVNVIADGVVTPRTLPVLQWEVLPSLPPDAPLEISQLPAPSEIAGAESPLLRPAIATGVIGVVVLAGWALVAVVRRWMRRERPVPPPPEPLPFPPSGLGHAEALLDTDPVAAYRSLATSVRLALARQHGFAATSLTTGELSRRMEEKGVDRWQARLVNGLLEECDAVVYAGYRPATARRHADLTMAREIVGEGA